MKILLLHNNYQQKGGEDSVLENEYQLLKQENSVEKLLFNNDNIKSSFDKLKIGVSSLYNYKSSKLLEQKIDEFKPDIIHVHNFFPIASPSIFYVAQQLNIPIVMTLHNYRLICPNALLFKDNEICEKCINKTFPIDGVVNGCYRDSKVQTLSLALMSFFHKKVKTWNNKVDKYITLTNFAKEKILHSSLNLNSKQIVVKPNFVEDYGYSYEKEDYFIFIGRLSIEKGINLLLDTFKKNNKKLLIIGGGSLEKEVLTASDSHENITYLGFQGKEFIIEKLTKAKALIFSSIWYEGMPMTILESFSTGTPVLVPNIGGPNEMIENNVNGLIYDANNVNSLIQSINTLLDKNDEDYKEMCINARESYLEAYSPSKNYEYLMNIYKEVIDAKSYNN